MDIDADQVTTNTTRSVLEGQLFDACLHEACVDLLGYEAQLSALDRAIGDGDHGANLARGARAILHAQSEFAGSTIGQKLERAGNLMVTNVGGASGPLYGSFLLAVARTWPDTASVGGVAIALAEGAGAVARRGKSATGEKTILDVLVPAIEALKKASSSTAGDAIAAMVNAAEAGLEATKPLRASKGRAAYVGERSVGPL